jgi:hypothetical protein
MIAQLGHDREPDSRNTCRLSAPLWFQTVSHHARSSSEITLTDADGSLDGAGCDDCAPSDELRYCCHRGLGRVAQVTVPIGTMLDMQ